MHTDLYSTCLESGHMHTDHLLNMLRIWMLYIRRIQHAEILDTMHTDLLPNTLRTWILCIFNAYQDAENLDTMHTISYSTCRDLETM